MANKSLKRHQPDDEPPTPEQTSPEHGNDRDVRQKTEAKIEGHGLPSMPVELSEASQLSTEDSEEIESATSEEASDASSTSKESSDDEEEPSRNPSEAEAEDEDEGIANVAPRSRKPPFTNDGHLDKTSSIRQRLDAFLPQLRNANADLDRLQREGQVSSMDVISLDEDAAAEGKGIAVNDDDVEAGEMDEGSAPYVEMDLGLGVLEERREEGEEASDYSEDSDDKDAQGGPVRPPVKEGDVLGKLMGRSTEQRAPRIEEV